MGRAPVRTRVFSKVSSAMDGARKRHRDVLERPLARGIRSHCRVKRADVDASKMGGGRADVWPSRVADGCKWRAATNSGSGNGHHT